MATIAFLFFGDVVGGIGRKAIAKALPGLRAVWKPDLVVANVENLAHGRGMTPKTLGELRDAGVDAFTGGNHTWHNPLGSACLDAPEYAGRMVRPANVTQAREGVGSIVIEVGGAKIQLLNLLGSLLMKDEVENPFRAFDRLRDASADLAIVDLHAETTSEKEAFGHYVDGRAAAVLGTHTHVPTADAKILPGGTAYVTDVGRNGGRDTVVGFAKEEAVKRFLGPGAKAYDPPERGEADVNAVAITLDPQARKAVAIHKIHEIVVV